MYRKGKDIRKKTSSCFCLCSFFFWGSVSNSWIFNDISRNFLLGNRKQNSQMFNDDFHLPLYLPLRLHTNSRPGIVEANCSLPMIICPPDDWEKVEKATAFRWDREVPWFFIVLAQSCTHKARLYKEFHGVCPLVGIWTLPPPLSTASVPLPPPPPNQKVGWAGILACRWEVGGVPIPTTGEKLSTLPTLCLYRSKNVNSDLHHFYFISYLLVGWER